MTQQTNSFFMRATRKELDLTLVPKPGYAVPADLCGHVFINSSVGTVNSGGLPFPPQRPDGSHNTETGSPLLGGDSMIYRYDLDEAGCIRLKSRLLRPPCFYADEATRFWKNGQENPLYKKYGFRNFGLSRISLMLGVRNELCTAVLPVKFPGDAHSRILANYDAGRPYEFDPASLKIKTPIGWNHEWQHCLPAFIDFLFPLVQSTAHPCFDPLTQELFTVNFTKSLQSMVADTKLVDLLKLIPFKLEKKLEHKIDEIETKYTHVEDKKIFAEKAIEELNRFFGRIDREVKLPRRLWRGVKKKLEQVLALLLARETTLRGAVYLMCWQGEGQWQKWELIDENIGKPIAIQQCMHQTGMSRDYIILIDAGLKLSIDTMINNPFPDNPDINAFIRQITTAAMLDHTPMWLVRRADLKEGQATVVCKALKQPLDFETIHFTAEYDNPNGQITLYCAHNCTGCFAEWVRFYDTLALSGEAVAKEVVGIPASGIMDINRIGKYVIDGESGEIIKKNFVALKGNPDPEGKVGPNTWGLVLYTFRDIISAEIPNHRIKHIYWQMYGLDRHLLTNFIYDMYKDYKHRVVPLDEMKTWTERGVPFSLGRMNMETMQFEDYYEFAPHQIFRSIQFVPRAKEHSRSDIPSDMDGYIFCAVIAGEKQPDHSISYESQVWLFDAANLAQGPVCVLAHPELYCGSTLHSAWLPEAAQSKSSYKVDVRPDYQPLIDKTFLGLRWPFLKAHRRQIQEIFDLYVYPNY